MGGSVSGGKQLKVEPAGTFRAQVFQMGGDPDDGGVPQRPPYPQTMVEVRMMMPLSDARRLGALMYQWLELDVTTAKLEDPDEG